MREKRGFALVGSRWKEWLRSMKKNVSFGVVVEDLVVVTSGPDSELCSVEELSRPLEM